MEQVVVVQFLSHVWLFVSPWTAACQASLSFTICWSLPKLMSNESVTSSNHLILCHPLLLLPSSFPSTRVFSKESALRIMRSKDRSFSISPSNEYSGLISSRSDWFDLFAVQGTLKSLLQHHNSKVSILGLLSLLLSSLWFNSYICTWSGRTTPLTICIFVIKVMFLLFSLLSKFVIAFLPRSKHILILWLQSPSTVEQIIPSIVIINIHNFFEILKCHSFRSWIEQYNKQNKCRNWRNLKYYHISWKDGSSSSGMIFFPFLSPLLPSFPLPFFLPSSLPPPSLPSSIFSFHFYWSIIDVQ